MAGHLPNLISDLALILGSAAVTTIIFKKLKQPLVLGYIIAGLLVGPQIGIVPTVTDTANIKTWAEIGVIFLLFSLGLEFSFKKLVSVGGTASTTAFVEIIFITFAGYFVGKLMGWKTIDCIFLGGMLASSSTTIIIRAFDELGVKTKQFAMTVFGILIVEDIVVILILVLLPTIAISQQIQGAELAFTSLKLIFFLGLWFLCGIFIVPSLLKMAKKFMDSETLLVLSIGFCLGMVVLATQVGFSAELGAFIMGSIFAETTSAEKIEHTLKPVKDLFGAVFFVSIGMMIDLSAMWEYKIPIIVITLLTIFGKLFSTSLGALISGQPLKQSVQVGMSMAQIGEFAFIIATLGITLKVTSEFLFPVAVGVSAITTFTTPYMIKYSDKLYVLLERILPERILSSIRKYSASTQTMRASNEWQIALKGYVTMVVTNGIIVIAIIVIANQFLLPLLLERIKNPMTGHIVATVITLIISLPFLYAMAIKKPRNWAYKELWSNNKYNRGPLIVVELVRLLITLQVLGFLFDRLLSSKIVLFVIFPILIIALYMFRRRIQLFYSRIEKRFLINLHEREKAIEDLKRPNYYESDLSPWDAHIAEFTVNPLAGFVGQSLLEIGWREKYGINIALIERGAKTIYAPGRDEVLYPMDKLSIIGTDDQLNELKAIIECNELNDQEEDEKLKISLEKLIVDEFNKLKGLSIRNSGIRERTNGLVVGIERNGKRILNPSSDEVFFWEDIVWIVGERKKILAIEKPPKSA
jgi:CPA2 family monovalent cation:H+ antiporter-2